MTDRGGNVDKKRLAHLKVGDVCPMCKQLKFQVPIGKLTAARMGLSLVCDVFNTHVFEMYGQ